MIRLCLFMILAIDVMAYDQKHIKVQEGPYLRYVKPQVKNIMSDYKNLLAILLPDFKEFKTCLKQINSIYNESILKEKTKGFHETLIELRNTIDKTELKEKQSLVNSINVSLTIDKKEVLEYKKSLKYIYNQFYFMIIENLDTTFKNQFNLFWIEFISPIQREIIIKNNKNFLQSRLTSLNTAWNSFNVHMNKRNVKLTKAQENRLEIIHRRWRSILKIVVKP